MKILARAALLALTLTVVLAAGPAEAATYVIDKAHSSVGFEVRHLAISKVRGTFDDFAGTFNYTPGQPGDWSVEATAQAASINTNNHTDAHRNYRNNTRTDAGSHNINTRPCAPTTYH